MKYINVIFGILIIIISIFMNLEIAFEACVVIVVGSLVMLVLNTIKCFKLYKNNKVELIKYICMVFTCIMLVILGLCSMYMGLSHAETMNILESIGNGYVD